MSEPGSPGAGIHAVAAAGPPTAGGRGAGWSRMPGRRVYSVLDAAVVSFAAWTLVYQLALVVGGPIATTAFLRLAMPALAVAGAAWVVASARSRVPAGAEAGRGARLEGDVPILVVVAALGAAALALIANRPDFDDVFYVNQSTAVAQLGALPLRDTMFSDQVFAMLPGQYPPIASYEALLGVVADLIGVQAASVTYFLVPPVASFAAVLALWRLLSSWELSWPRSALVVSLLYLLFGGAFHASFGNTWVERMWQGKILFISALVPLLLVYLVRLIRWRDWSGVLTATAAVVACVGLTSSAVFLLPAFLAAAAAAALAMGRWSGLLRLLIPGAYLVLLGLYWVLASGGPDLTGGLGAGTNSGSAIVTKVLGSGPYLLLGLAAWLVGWAAIRQREARAFVLVLAAGTAVGVSPVGLAVLELAGIPEPIWWRIMWLVPVAPLVGGLASGAAGLFTRGAMTRVAPLAPVAIGLWAVLAGQPIWSPANSVVLGWPTWKWSADVRSVNERLAEVVEPGDIIGAPESAGGLVASSSAQYWSVSPRNVYTAAMDFQDGFCAAERLAVADYAGGAREWDPQVADAVDQLGVTVLVIQGASPAGEELADLGFEPTGAAGILRREPVSSGGAAPRCTTPLSGPANADR